MLNYAVISSSRASSFQRIFQDAKHLDFINWHLAISNQPDAGILDFANQHQVDSAYIPTKNTSKALYSQSIESLLTRHKIDFVLLIGFMRILSKRFVLNRSNKIFNIHPSLLPKHQGLMDRQVHHDVLQNKEALTGCSLHVVTENVDEGPVVMQKSCQVEPTDTIESLRAKVQHLESTCLLAFLKEQNEIAGKYFLTLQNNEAIL